MRLLMVALAVAMIGGTAAARDDAGTAAGRAAFMAGEYDVARRILEPLAEAGDADAQYWIGVMFAHGRGYHQVCRQALRWYEKAARQGHAEATFNLGFMLYNGWGADPGGCRLASNPERAAPWLRKAAELGVARAQYLVGRMYRTGDGVPMSPDDALYWLKKAADGGIPEAQFDLALMYADTGDTEDAYFWFFVLAGTGYPGARHNADILARDMDPMEIYEAERRAYFRSLAGQ